MNTSEKKETPAQVLANRVAARLAKEGLLSKDRAARFSAALSSGKLKTGDWRLAIEAPKQPEAKSSAQ